MTTVSKKKRQVKIFTDIDATLNSRGYKKESVKGGHYWIYFLNELPFFYVANFNTNSDKIFIDFAHHDLKTVLSTIKGIIPPTGATTNFKFELFALKREFKQKDDRIHKEFEGWKFQFKDATAFDKFLVVCESYAAFGLEAAKNATNEFEKIVIAGTAKTIVAESRIGQQKFKKGLLKYWKACAVTGCTIEKILRGSHIKPWAIANDEERLDSFNGLLLVPNLDALFDGGFITFDKIGNIQISSKLEVKDYTALGLALEMKLRKINGAHSRYLKYHNEYVFKP
jgi:hypothetical protein